MIKLSLFYDVNGEKNDVPVWIFKAVGTVHGMIETAGYERKAATNAISLSIICASFSQFIY